MMYKETMGFVKGIGAGIVASVAVAAVGSQMMKNTRHLRRDAHRAMHAVGNAMQNVEHMFKALEWYSMHKSTFDLLCIVWNGISYSA